MKKRSKRILTLALLPFSLAMGSAAHSDQAHLDHHDHTPVVAAAVHHEHSLYHLNASWTDHRGQPLTLSRFQGQPVVITMMYGSCATACPILMHDLTRIQSALPTAVREQTQLIVASFDSERDTPEALAEYAADRHLDRQHWHFLHGERDQVRTLATLLGIRYRAKEDGGFDHSNVITVLDADGRIVYRSEGLLKPVEPAVAALEAAFEAQAHRQL